MIWKGNSSRWMNQHGSTFAWQEGYGAFSVSPGHLGRVKAYIHTHYSRRSFEDEFAAMLEASNIRFNPGEIFGSTPVAPEGTRPSNNVLRALALPLRCLS